MSGNVTNMIWGHILLGTPSPRSSRRWNFEISVAGAVPRHGVINWEEFGEKFWWVILHNQWSTKMPRKFRPIFRPILRPEFRPLIKICRHNFALGMSGETFCQLAAADIWQLCPVQGWAQRRSIQQVDWPLKVRGWTHTCHSIWGLSAPNKSITNR